MRVLFYESSSVGASPRLVATAARARATRGYEVRVAAPDESGLARESRRRGLPVMNVTTGGLLSRTRQLRKVLLEGYTDVICVHGDRDRLVATVATRLAGRAHVVRRLTVGERPPTSRVEQLSSRLAPAAYIVSASHSVPPLPSRRLGEAIVADAGIDLPALNGQLRPRRIACVGTRGAHTRVARALRAFAYLLERHPSLELVILGSAAHDDDVRMHTAALDIARRTIWTTPDTPRDDALAGVGAGIVAADGDEAALGILDFLARRIPVVAERSALTERYIAHGIHGELLDDFEPSRIAADIAVLLRDDNRRLSMGNAGRARVERDFTERTLANAFEQAARAVKGGERNR
jgi:glycosyltransferase involved in cell wall biosynthesis